jgi:hypothetical protein
MRRLFRTLSSILAGAVEAGDCIKGPGETSGLDARAGKRSGGPWTRSGVLKAKVIDRTDQYIS